MAVGGPGDFPLSGVGGSSLSRRCRDDSVGCGCTENGQKQSGVTRRHFMASTNHCHTLAHFNLHSSGIHPTDRQSFQRALRGVGIT